MHLNFSGMNVKSKLVMANKSAALHPELFMICSCAVKVLAHPHVPLLIHVMNEIPLLIYNFIYTMSTFPQTLLSLYSEK